MEACASAHHWGRQFRQAGREVLLINPRFVKPFVRGSKNDAVDAAAIYEAATRPTMRFVPVKSTAQQDLQSLHRIRERLIIQRTSLFNHARGLLAEYGIVLPQGPWNFAAQAPSAVENAPQSDLGRELFLELLDQLTDVNGRVSGSIGRSVRFAANETIAVVSPSCQALARSLRLHWWRVSKMGAILNQGENWQHGSGWSRDNIRPAANHASVELAAERTTISVDR
ncbi:transposase (plasmid) [Agrobacterium tumefaciens]|uniref:Transposase IS110-like N-terminal domain-containing protein n=1 Tax=Agrobacterium tumefaciens str. B6 TaxID=1183423 RepID=A0A822VCN2_AGRTU|nr:mobile element protein [Agrobacterium tumefaciens LBA4213 (Ach5)]AKC11056.1 transposase [Agrobacterium tumefaciens]AYM20346.1 transposase [Agrobacterium tumefaciens]AYM71647.1 transposase [Agrobacterium tumefaciens]CVI25560.1 hypothetical protein AGR4A_pTi0158 [Agrobacterium tumefaciens str. B6]